MDYKELLKKYQALLVENNHLKEEIKRLKSQQGIPEQPGIPFDFSEQNLTVDILGQHSMSSATVASLNNWSDPMEKIKLFMSLFKGRDDVYAKRWENKKKGTSGYSPVCLNEWKNGVCTKPKGTCSTCSNKAYAGLDQKVIDDHLRGRNDFVVGIYPLCLDETCCFLAIDFDAEEWKKDITALREGCVEYNIFVAIERSRSGNGAHAWFFFENPVSAILARRFGSALLSYSMSKRHEITFKSYDRFFPNQDTMPKGGLGNLIALPMQRTARYSHNSVFIDENFEPYNDQWAFLASMQKMNEEEIERLVGKLSQGSELGVLRKDEEEEDEKPWEKRKVKLVKTDFPRNIEIVKANMIFIPKAGISQRALNQLQRLTAFKNPEFYKAQAMRLSVKKIPRIISCFDETTQYLCLPRGCEADLKALFNGLTIEARFIDETNNGKSIDVKFNGSLRDEQPEAIDKLLKADCGVLSGTTAFGKTVVAIKLIAERKVNTLILVDKVSLVSQWQKRLSEFLTINESLSNVDEGKRRGRKRLSSIIGQLGAGKDNLNGIIDIAVMQSLNRMGEVKECVNNYGMIIVDECHHVSAFSFEKILRNTKAKYVYGLTATPTRKDGHHPIIFMQCGPILYRDDAKKQAERRPFDHFVIPRFTSFRVSVDKEKKELSIQDLYAEIVTNELRNQLIVDDVVKSHGNGRNSIVLTERVAHVEVLSQKLSKVIPNVFALTGGMGTKETREILKQIAETPADQPLTLVATGKYIGEGFDEPRLDTLFLVMPISWKGTLQQYAGRLHRLFENKNEVQIYDYVDIHEKMLEKMYHRRLTGYASIGYKTKGENIAPDSINIIFDKHNFLPVYSNDILNAAREILIVSPYITKKRTIQMISLLKSAIDKEVKIIVVTRPVEDFNGKDMTSLQSSLGFLKDAGISLVFRSNIHQKFAVIDQKIVWYGSINLLSFGSAEESIMRLESPTIANELMKLIES